MTHPFHPWVGRGFVFVGLRRTGGEDRVFFLDEDGTQKSLPRGWTDAADPDVFVALAAGRSLKGTESLDPPVKQRLRTHGSALPAPGEF